MTRGDTAPQVVARWLRRPQSIDRLVVLRVLAPLAVLGFMSTRVTHAGEWLGDAGFSVPDVGGDWRQPLYLPPLPEALAWLLAGVLVASGLALVVGFRTRTSAAVFAATLIYVALADRLAAFTVSKLSPAVMLTLAVSHAGWRHSVDAWWAARRGAPLGYVQAPGGPIRFIQLLLPTFYCASGICKVRGDWLDRGDVLFTHLHDSYQTAVSHWLANELPTSAWFVFQVATLVFEVGAPLWFAWARTRTPALLFGVALHVMIGVMFGPVKWFSALMIALLLAAYMPQMWLKRVFSVWPIR